MLKLQNEHWFLVAALVIGGGLMAFRALGLEPLEPPAAGRVNNPQAFDPAPYQEAARRFLAPPEIKNGEHKVYVSRLVAYFPGEQSVRPVSPDLKDPAGITIQWKLEHKFDISDPTVAEADPDQDGFSNREEFNAKTHPLETGSRPPLVRKLRVEKYTKVPFRVIFKGYNPDAATGKMLYQLNLLDVKTNKTRMVKEGDMIEGYQVGEFRKNVVTEFDERTKSNREVDKSELDLLNLKLNEKVILIRNREIESDESFVQLRVDSPIGKVEPSRVIRGDKFTLDGKEFQLLKPGEKSISIKDLQSGEVLEGVGE